MRNEDFFIEKKNPLEYEAMLYKNVHMYLFMCLGSNKNTTCFLVD